MGRLILQRSILGVLTLLAASALIFVGTEILPGDLASAILQNRRRPENLAKIRLDLGLDRPAIVRYSNGCSARCTAISAIRWPTGAMSSRRSRRASPTPCSWRPTQRWSRFRSPSASASLAAIRQGGVFDRLVNVVTLMTISVPEYFLAYLLIKYVAVDLGWFPSLANVTPDTPFLERLYYAFLPMLTLVLVHRRAYDAHDPRLGARGDGEPLYRDGDPEGTDAVAHRACATRLPNALAPIISVIALNLAYLIVGVVVVETVFVYPGLGQLMVDEVSKHDVPVVQACGLIFAAAFILLNMVADILAIISNPRLRQPR